MYTPVIKGENDCIDDEYVSSVIDNLEYFNECSKTNSRQFVCKRIDQEQTGLVSNLPTEMCFDLQTLSTTTNPDDGGEIETKMLLFNYRSSSNPNISDSANAGQVTPVRTLRVVCNGETIQTLDYLQTGAPIITACFECPKNSDVQLCFDSRFVATGQAGLISGTQSIEVCGALICISETDNQVISGYFSPPAFRDGCSYGREALHMIIQNLSALRAGFAEFGQVPTCQLYDFDDQDDHVLLNTAPTQTDFLILGSLRIAGENVSTTSEATISGKPTFTCGNDSYSCLTQSASIPAASGGPRTGFLNVPIVMCGTCQAGDSLTASIRSQLVCNERASQVVEGFGGGITFVEQHYCVYLFSRIETDFGDELNGSLGKCIDIDVINAISDNMELINGTCDNQAPITLTERQIVGVAAAGECITIQEALPWPPITDPPTTGPPPVKKWYVIGSVLPCSRSLGGLNFEDLRVVRAQADIQCGGEILLSQLSQWQLTGSGDSQPCGFSMDFSRCIECAIDEDLTVCFTSEQLRGFGGKPNEFTYSFKIFCF